MNSGNLTGSFIIFDEPWVRTCHMRGKTGKPRDVHVSIAHVAEQPSCSDPPFHVVVLSPPQLDQCADAETVLSVATPLSRNTPCPCWSSAHPGTLATMGGTIPKAEEVLATQFLYQLMLTLFHTKSIVVQPSVMGYIMHSVSLVGQRKKLAVLRLARVETNVDS